MTFFDDLNDAVIDNAGLFMIGHMIQSQNNVSRMKAIAKSQAESTAIQEESLYLQKEQIRIQEETLRFERDREKKEREFNERVTQENALADVQLRDFRNLLSYSELMIDAESNTNEFILGSLEILYIMLHDQGKCAKLTKHDTDSLQKFRHQLFASRKTFMVANREVSCVSAATKKLILFEGKLREIVARQQTWKALFQKLLLRIYTPLKNPRLLVYAVGISDGPFKSFYPPGYSFEVAKNAMRDRYGAVNVSDKDIEQLQSQVESGSLLIASDAELLAHQISNPLEQSLTLEQCAVTYLAEQSSVEETLQTLTTHDVLLALTRSSDTQTLQVDPDIQIFLNVLGYIHADDTDRWNQSIPSATLQAYQQFLNMLTRCDREVVEANEAVIQLTLIKDGQFWSYVEEGVEAIRQTNNVIRSNMEKQRREAIQERVSTFKRNSTSRYGDARLAKPVGASNLLSNSDRTSIAEAIAMIELGNVASSEKLFGHLQSRSAGQSTVQSKELLQAIAPLEVAIIDAKARVNAIDQAASVVRTEFEKMSAPSSRLRLLRGNSEVSIKALEQSLKYMHSLVIQGPFQPGSELGSRLGDLVAQVQPACRAAKICFNWQPQAIPIDHYVAKLQIRNNAPMEVFLNALCAIAACDGDFCMAEQKVVKQVINELQVELPDKKVSASIFSFCREVRQGSLQRVIGQSIADLRLLQNTNLASQLENALKKMVFADGNVATAEKEVFQQMMKAVSVSAKSA